MADSKQDVLDMLHELAELTMLEEGDPNSFRVRAYESAAQSIAAQASDLGKLTVQELQKIEGIGKSTAEKIRELIETGKVPSSRRCAQKHPPAVVALLRIQGLGPKALKRLRAELGVGSIDDLRRVLARAQAARPQGLRTEVGGQPDAVAGAPGAAGRRRAHADLGGAAAGDAKIVARLAEVPGVTHASTCGSLRRFSETIGDVDILVAAPEPEPVMDALVALPAVDQRARARRLEDQRGHPARHADRRARGGARRSWARRCSTSPAPRATTSSFASGRWRANGR